jgi:hypothetical protein
MTLKIEQEEAQKILNYLASRPYAEVAELVPILLNLKAPVVAMDANDTTTELFDDKLDGRNST